jgi:hypothetical protein
MGFEKALGGSVPKEGRHSNDYYPTCPIGTRCLIKSHDMKGLTIHEPAAGRGWMAKEFIDNGFSVIATDLYPYDNTLCPIEFGKDFLLQKSAIADVMVTNPPYKKDLAEKFILHSLDIGYKVTAVLCRIMFAEGKGRGKRLYKPNRPSDVYVFDQRINFLEYKFDTRKGQLSGMIPFSWWVWDTRRPWYGQETRMNWIFVDDILIDKPRSLFENIS